MSTPVQRLTEMSRPALREHFLKLGPDDVHLRFGTLMRPETIVAYVDRIDFSNDAVFGVFDNALVLTGVAHVGFGIDSAELGVSVLSGHRGKGIGSALVARAAEHARNRFFNRLFMHCLAENSAMIHIARKAGMQICINTGDAEGSVALPRANAASLAGEFVDQRLALFDYALKSQVVTMKRMTGAAGLEKD